MSARRLAIAIASSFLLNGQEAFAQSGFPVISLKVGVIRNLQDSFYRDLPKYSFYPEIEINTQLARSSAHATAAYGGVYWGYWDDGVDKASGACVDCHTYSFSSHILGVRMGLLLEKFPIVPTGLAVGFSRHFIQAKFVGGSDFAGNPGQDFERSANTIEAIAFATLKIGKRASGILEFQRFWPVKNSYLAEAPFSRSAFKLGVALSR